MDDHNDKLPTAVCGHQSSENGVRALLAVMAAICFGMFWIGTGIWPPQYMKNDSEFFSACAAAARTHQSLIVTQHWNLDSGTCDAHLIFLGGSLHISRGSTVFLGAGGDFSVEDFGATKNGRQR